MNISGLQKLTLTDFPGHLACIIFTQGCNFKCPFCQNSDLLNIQLGEGEIKESEVLEYLNKRKNMLEGVVITGGEPLLQPDLENFILKIKDTRLKVKLDTNGSSPHKLADLIRKDLIDYVAMDVKNDELKYEETSGTKKTNLENIHESINILKKSNIPHEFRTTIVKEFHTYQNIYNICNLLGISEKYYIQNFEDSERVINHDLHGFSKDELNDIRNKITKDFPNVKIRGI